MTNHAEYQHSLIKHRVISWPENIWISLSFSPRWTSPTRPLLDASNCTLRLSRALVIIHQDCTAWKSNWRHPYPALLKNAYMYYRELIPRWLGLKRRMFRDGNLTETFWNFFVQSTRCSVFRVMVEWFSLCLLSSCLRPLCFSALYVAFAWRKLFISEKEVFTKETSDWFANYTMRCLGNENASSTALHALSMQWVCAVIIGYFLYIINGDDKDVEGFFHSLYLEFRFKR